MALSRKEVLTALQQSDATDNVRNLGFSIAANFRESQHECIKKLLDGGWAVDEIAFRPESDYYRVYFVPLEDSE